MSYDQSRAELETLVERELATLLSDPAPAVKRAVLESIASFGLFLGRQKTDDVVLSHLLTFLNDGDWVLRHDFVGAVVDVAALVGEGAAEQLLLPLVVQALADPEEAVLARVLAALRALAELELLGRVRLWEVAAAAVGLLAHPNVWIRQSRSLPSLLRSRETRLIHYLSLSLSLLAPSQPRSACSAPSPTACRSLTSGASSTRARARTSGPRRRS